MVGALPRLRFGCLLTWKHPDGTFPVVDQQQQRVYNGRFYSTIFMWDESVCTKVFLH